jgi:hypothetical protein
LLLNLFYLGINSYADEVLTQTQSLPPAESSASSSGKNSLFKPSFEGFYPIWETTGFVQYHRHAYVGSNGANFGIKNLVQVGTQPFSFVYRTPNIYAKFALYNQDEWHLAAQIGTFYLLDRASQSFMSPMYTSRLANPDYNITLIPVSFAATKEFSDWLQLHQTLTALAFRSSSSQLKNEINLGYSAVAEFLALEHHSVLFHFEEVGMWSHDLFALGTSYRFHNSWLELRAGYFYRFQPGAAQASPQVGFGFSL